jgi:hypothetical protein
MGETSKRKVAKRTEGFHFEATGDIHESALSSMFRGRYLQGQMLVLTSHCSLEKNLKKEQQM